MQLEKRVRSQATIGERVEFYIFAEVPRSMQTTGNEEQTAGAGV